MRRRDIAVGMRVRVVADADEPPFRHGLVGEVGEVVHVSDAGWFPVLVRLETGMLLPCNARELEPIRVEQLPLVGGAS